MTTPLPLTVTIDHESPGDPDRLLELAAELLEGLGDQDEDEDFPSTEAPEP